MQSVMLVAEEGIGRPAFHASGHLDTVVVCLLCFNNLVDLHSSGVSVPVYLPVLKPLAVSNNASQGRSS